MNVNAYVDDIILLKHLSYGISFYQLAEVFLW